MPGDGQNITETISKRQINAIKLLCVTEIYNLLSVWWGWGRSLGKKDKDTQPPSLRPDLWVCLVLITRGFLDQMSDLKIAKSHSAAFSCAGLQRIDSEQE